MKTIRTLSDIKERCTIDGDCWLWGGGTGGNGYPTAKIDGTPRYVRRVAIEYAGRKLMRGRHVTSTCGCITCVNPDHISQNKHDTFHKTNMTLSKIQQHELRKVHTLELKGIGANGEKRICHLSKARAVEILSATEYLWEIQPNRSKDN